MAARADGRAADQLRPVRLTVDYVKHAEGSVLIEMGETRVLCVATVQEGVPPFLEGRGQGWVTAEYAMLPRAGTTRSPRESVTGKVGGRTHEIQRLIGRSLRAVTDLRGLGERTVVLDCDVIQADGGTRTAAITGAWVALHRACAGLVAAKVLRAQPVRQGLAAVSAGIVQGVPLLDLAYTEDSRADVDSNVIMTDAGTFVEVQATAERAPYTRQQLDELLALAEKGIRELFTMQREHVG